MTHRRLIFVIFVVGWVFSSPAEAKALTSDYQKFALVIGIRGYPNFPEGERLSYADSDAQKFRDFILTAAGGSFPQENVRLLLNGDAKRAAIFREVEWLSDRVKTVSEAVVYVFFAGHGVTDGKGRAFLMPFEAAKTNPQSSGGIRANDFIRELKESISARHLVVFIDACHAGAAISTGGTARGGPNVTSEFTKAWEDNYSATEAIEMGFLSASSNQSSFEDDSLKQGLFTYCLLKGLKGAADRYPQDGRVTSGELHRYLLDTVEDLSRKFGRQTPIVTPAFETDLVLAAIPTIESLIITVRHLKFFEKGFGPPPPRGERPFAARFAKGGTRAVSWELDFDTPVPGVPLAYKVTARWFGPAGDNIYNEEVDVTQRDDSPGHVVASGGYGWKTPGNLAPGRYRVEVTVGTRKVASKTFEISDTAAPLTPTVVSLKLYESGHGGVAYGKRQYATRFSKEATRYISWELMLRHPAPGSRVGLTVDAVWYKDGAVFCKTTRDHYIEPEWDSPFLNGECGWQAPGNWASGAYRVELFTGGQRIAGASFEVVSSSDPVILTATYLKFFETDDGTRPPVGNRVYATRFPKESVNYIHWEVGLSHVSPFSRVNFDLLAVWYKPDGSVEHRQTLSSYIEPGWTTSHHAEVGWGCKVAGCWKPGVYRVELFLGGTRITSQSFEIF